MRQISAIYSESRVSFFRPGIFFIWNGFATIVSILPSNNDFLKKKVIEIEENIEDINIDLHHVKPEYLKKLEAIKKEGTVSSAEFEKKFLAPLEESKV
ncbi:MAG: hypothetical protein Q8O41_10535 [Candidatus Methanoperedens sp.]|nr:hypothetical protein [Candidatus Methanoperedens sp.]